MKLTAHTFQYGLKLQVPHEEKYPDFRITKKIHSSCLQEAEACKLVAHAEQ